MITSALNGTIATFCVQNEGITGTALGDPTVAVHTPTYPLKVPIVEESLTCSVQDREGELDTVPTWTRALPLPQAHSTATRTVAEPWAKDAVVKEVAVVL